MLLVSNILHKALVTRPSLFVSPNLGGNITPLTVNSFILFNAFIEWIEEYFTVSIDVTVPAGADEIVTAIVEETLLSKRTERTG